MSIVSYRTFLTKKTYAAVIYSFSVYPQNTTAKCSNVKHAFVRNTYKLIVSSECRCLTHGRTFIRRIPLRYPFCTAEFFKIGFLSFIQTYSPFQNLPVIQLNPRFLALRPLTPLNSAPFTNINQIADFCFSNTLHKIRTAVIQLCISILLGNE